MAYDEVRADLWAYVHICPGHDVSRPDGSMAVAGRRATAAAILFAAFDLKQGTDARGMLEYGCRNGGSKT